jgi:hypothetical protein
VRRPVSTPRGELPRECPGASEDAADVGVVLSAADGVSADVDVGEALLGAGPEGFELDAQLVGERDSGFDEVLAGGHQRPERERLVTGGRDQLDAVTAGAGELAEDQSISQTSAMRRLPRSRSLPGIRTASTVAGAHWLALCGATL